MKNNRYLRVALVATLCILQGAVSAQPGRGNDNGRGHDNGRGNGCGNGRPDCEAGPGNSRDHGNNRFYDQRRDDRRPDFARHDDGEQGAGPDHSFYRGQRLPPYYRSHQYVVDDWRGHGLRTPPRGYHWVQTGGDYVLVAITTGLILELLLNH